MGLFAGLLTALALLPAALLVVGLSWNQGLSVAAKRAQLLAELRLSHGEDEAAFPYRAFDAAAVVVRRGEDLTVEVGDASLQALLRRHGDGFQALCREPGHDYLQMDDGQRWAWACRKADDLAVLAAVDTTLLSPFSLGLVMALVILVVALVTALLILRLLTPLSRISSALVRVGAGERDVRLHPTGLPELDELIYHLNDAALAMEQREDAITARIRLVQNMARLVAHEVRNPLQSIELLTTLLQAEPDETARTEHATAIRQEIRVLDDVVHRLLRRSVGADLDLHGRPARLATLVGTVVRLLERQARTDGIQLTQGALPDIELVLDQALVGRSLQNLVLNGIQHAGSQVRISATVLDDEVQLHVDDDGPGVDPGLAERVFEPNVSGRAGGTGLGLALVREVVEAHKGRVHHADSPLGGARFTVTIPRPAAPSAPANVGPDAPSTDAA